MASHNPLSPIPIFPAARFVGFALSLHLSHNAVPAPRVLRALLAAGAQLEQHSGHGGMTLLAQFCRFSPAPTEAMLRALLDAGASPAARDAARMTPLMHLMQNPCAFGAPPPSTARAAADAAALAPLRLLLSHGGANARTLSGAITSSTASVPSRSSTCAALKRFPRVQYMRRSTRRMTI